MRILLLFFLFIFVFSVPGQAQDSQKFMDTLPPEGSTVLTLSATERMSLSQDEIVASLRYEVRGGSPKDVQDKINKAMQDAIERAKKEEALEVTTGSYQVNERYENRRVVGWMGAQGLNLVGKDKDALLEVVADIQTMGFAMNNLSFRLSTGKAESVQDQLMTQALEKLQHRATVAAKALGKSTIQFVQISEGYSQMPRPVPMMMRTMSDAVAESVSIAAPVVEGGDSDVTLTVNARILISP